jgi:hypothetical protein
MATSRQSGGVEPWVLGLVALCLVPLGAGWFRLQTLARGAAVTAENARFVASPVPVAVHVVAATLFGVLGAFQLASGFGGGRRLRRHRALGKLLWVSGLFVALSGLWMTLFYPNAEGDGLALFWMRVVVGSGMIVSLLLGARAITRRDFVEHGAWMLRAYALGMGAGTQAVLLIPPLLALGHVSMGLRAVLMGSGWLLNVLVAEWRLGARGVMTTA